MFSRLSTNKIFKNATFFKNVSIKKLNIHYYAFFYPFNVDLQISVHVNLSSTSRSTRYLHTVVKEKIESGGGLQVSGGGWNLLRSNTRTSRG
jgi:hypothetical protein